MLQKFGKNRIKNQCNGSFRNHQSGARGPPPGTLAATWRGLGSGVCDLGSIVSTMPKIVYDSLKLDMDKLSSYHEHANGDILEVKGKVKGVQVAFLHRIAPMDFFIMEPNQSNIVLGRNFLRAMRGFIDIGNGLIRLCGKTNGRYLFPKKNKNE